MATERPLIVLAGPIHPDGKAVLEVLFAAYASAREGRRIELPFATDAARPIDLWRPA